MKFVAGLFAASLSVIISGSAFSAAAADATAFDLIKEGNRYVGEQAKDRIVQVRSEKSVGTLTPNIWYVTYYDPTATLKSVEVKFGAGKMLGVKRPLRLLEPVTGGDLPLDREKIKIDSDKALQSALKDPMLEHIKVSSTQLNLKRAPKGVLGRETGEAVWVVKLWAPKLRNPSREADIGEVFVSAADGKILQTDLHLDRLD